MPTAAVVSFRLGGGDGVSVESAKWSWALCELGFDVVMVAGEGAVDRRVPGLAIGAAEPPTAREMSEVLADADLVVVENLCSLPLNPRAAAVVANVCRGRPTVLHHHDLPWQRPQFASQPPPPDDPAWRHVVINELSRAELGRRGIEATTIYNAFNPNPPLGQRWRTRRLLGLGDGTLVLQPTRALPRKNVAAGLALAEAIDAAFWLLGPAEDGYGPELDRLLSKATCRVVRGPVDAKSSTEPGDPVADAYAACDVVALPSTWEGFGNPTIESALYRKPLAIGSYPVSSELAAFGFRWFSAADPRALSVWLEERDPHLLEHNYALAARHFPLAELPGHLSAVLGTLGLPVSC